jgi:hypothetical protein
MNLTLKIGRVLLLVLFFTLCANAGLIFTLDNPAQEGLPGTNLSFTGVLTNSGGPEVFINQAIGDLVYPGLSIDYTDFFLFIPRSLNAGESYTGEIFAVTIDPSAPVGSVTATFEFKGGVDNFATDSVGIQSFGAAVVPEPSTATFLVGGLCFLLLAVMKRSGSARRINA